MQGTKISSFLSILTGIILLSCQHKDPGLHYSVKPVFGDSAVLKVSFKQLSDENGKIVLKYEPVYFLTRGNWQNLDEQKVFEILNETIKFQYDFWKDSINERFTVTLIPTFEEWTEFSKIELPGRKWSYKQLHILRFR